MNKEIKEKWIKALRGEGEYKAKYKQGKGQLRIEDNCFCCLGVLCDVINPEAWNGLAYKYKGQYSRTGLLNEINVDFGISPAQESILINMNDDEGASFKQIADYVEKVL